MGHRTVRSQLEEFAQSTLPPEQRQVVERHLADCSECNRHLHTLGWTRAMLRANRLKNGPEPSPGFARRLAGRLESHREVYLFWLPLRSMALKAIPVMALLTLLLGAMAYRQGPAEPPALAEWEDPLLESYSEQRESLTKAIFSESVAGDPNLVVRTLMGDPAIGVAGDDYDESF